MRMHMKKMWAAKLGLVLKDGVDDFDYELFSELQKLMIQTPVDYTMFFRELSSIPDDIEPLKKSFYNSANNKKAANTEEMDKRWQEWLVKWKALLVGSAGANEGSTRSKEEISAQMKRVNPKYILREWFVKPAYQQAQAGDYSLIKELQDVMTNPYAEQSQEIDSKYYRLKPAEFFAMGGVSHLSCSS